MFGSLSSFEGAGFFQEHPTFIIELPGKKMTYQIYAAYRFSSVHLLENYDYRSTEGFAAYLEEAKTAATVSGHYREESEATAQDRIVTLSTCVDSGQEEYRYLVQGVLREEE